MRAMRGMLAVLLVACGADERAGVPDASADAAGTPAVSFEEAPGEAWACSAPESCVDDYYAFSTQAEEWARAVSEEEVIAQIDAIDAGEVPVLTDPLPADELAAALLDALDMEFLLDGLEERPLRVGITGRETLGDVVQTDLLIEDPFVGRFPALLLEPAGDGPFPALVALHGHGDDAAVYRDDYHGGEWPARGYAILIPTLRAMNIDTFEYEVTMDLLEHGFDLIALRAYEALLCRRVLAALPEIDELRIGLIGHSGGSSTGNLVVRVAPGFAAFVSDNAVDYLRSGFELPHCETAPEVFPYHELVNDFSTAPQPVLDVPYGYANGMEAIFAFMDEHVRDAP